jgi:hypothetical protein
VQALLVKDTVHELARRKMRKARHLPKLARILPYCEECADGEGLVKPVRSSFCRTFAFRRFVRRCGHGVQDVVDDPAGCRCKSKRTSRLIVDVVVLVECGCHVEDEGSRRKCLCHLGCCVAAETPQQVRRTALLYSYAVATSGIPSFLRSRKPDGRGPRSRCMQAQATVGSGTVMSNHVRCACSGRYEHHPQGYRLCQKLMTPPIRG